MNCFRFFGFKSLDEVDRLSLQEYLLLIKAQNLKTVDEDYRSHLSAWLTMVAIKSEKRSKRTVKPVYDRFIKFYDYEEALEKAGKRSSGSGRDCKFPHVAKLLKKGGTDNG